MRLCALALIVAAALTAQSVPQAAKAYERGGRALKTQDLAEARRQFETAVMLDPSHARAWYELARLQLPITPAVARESLEAALRADPKLFDAHLLLIKLAAAAREWNRLVEISDRLVKLNPVDYPAAFVAHAVGHYHLGNRATAEISLRAGQDIDPGRTTPELWRLMGLILAERGDYAGAAAQWREYLKHASSWAAAREIQARLADAEARAGAAPAGPTFRAETELAVVRFAVSPKRGRFLTDLRAEDVEIREDGIPQKSALFEGGRFYPRTLPLEISLLFDASGSVQSAGNLNPYVFQQTLLDEYENASIAIFAFSDQLMRLTPPTRHPQMLKKAMDAVLTIRPGITPLFRYITETLQWATARPGAARILIVFSDGEAYGPGESGLVENAVEAAKERGVAVYSVLLHRSTGANVVPGATVSGMPDPLSVPPSGFIHYPTMAENMESVQNFFRLARETGGQSFDAVPGDDALRIVLTALARRIQYEYVAGYYPASTGTKKRHAVEVVLKDKDRGTIVGGKRIVVH